MATFVLIHGAGDSGWYWHLVEAELQARGHDTVAPDLPCDDDSAGLPEYRDTVAGVAGGRDDLVVVAQSAGGLTAPLVCGRLAVKLLVLIAPIIPAPGEAPADYWARTRYYEEPRDRYDDATALFYQDVPPELAAEALTRGRPQSEARMGEPWPLRAWPDVPTRVLIGRDDHLFPAAFLRRVTQERLGITPDEIDSGHAPALSRPRELTDRLEAYAAGVGLAGAASKHTPGRTGYDAELRRYDEVLRRAFGVQPGDRVLDIGCGTGQTTRQAARTARAGSALGVDVSAPAIGRARELTRAEGLGNVSFEHADAQVHRFPPESFDVAVSRFGTMFFADPRAAFANIGRALRPTGRLVMMVWQAREGNEWDVAIRQALAGPEGAAATVDGGPDPFSLADPPAVEETLAAAGFADAAFTDVRAPVYYGPDVAAALDWVSGFTSTSNVLSQLDPDAAARATGRLRGALAAHLRDDGVWFSSRAWIVAARRR